MSGKLIVIEGSDGSGKSVQTELLADTLRSQGEKVEVIEIPQYEEFYGKLLTRFLTGELGTLANANPYLLSVIYALNRAEVAPRIQKWLDEGNIVIANRYATSNLAHQGGRLSPDEREKFIAWNQELEYEKNKLPKEDLVIFLHVPYKISEELLMKDKKERDMVESDSEYLRKSEEMYLWLAKNFPHWVMVECVQNEKLRTKEDIHEEVKKILNL